MSNELNIVQALNWSNGSTDIHRDVIDAQFKEETLVKLQRDSLIRSNIMEAKMWGFDTFADMQNHQSKANAANHAKLISDQFCSNDRVCAEDAFIESNSAKLKYNFGDSDIAMMGLVSKQIIGDILRRTIGDFRTITAILDCFGTIDVDAEAARDYYEENDDDGY
jgi:hypothetical protein